MSISSCLFKYFPNLQIYCDYFAEDYSGLTSDGGFLVERFTEFLKGAEKHTRGEPSKILVISLSYLMYNHPETRC